jgi:hypothetical protein
MNILLVQKKSMVELYLHSLKNLHGEGTNLSFPIATSLQENAHATMVK